MEKRLADVCLSNNNTLYEYTTYNIFNNLQNHQLNIKKYTKENVFRLHQFDTIALKLSKRNDCVYSKEYTAVLERFLHLDLECLSGRSLFQDLAGR